MTGEFEIARIAVALVGTAVATYYDLTHNRNVPDWLSFGMLGLGVLAAAGVLLTSGIQTAIALALPAVIVLGAGYLFYRAGQIGGADVVIFAAIALLMPDAPAGIFDLGGAQARVLVLRIPFVFSLFLASGILFGIVTFARFLAPCINAMRRGKIRLGSGQKLYLTLLAITGAVFVWFAQANRLPPQFMLIFIAALLFSAFFYIFKSFIAREFLIKMVGVRQMDEEDVLAIEEMLPEVVKKYGLKKLLTREEIARLGKLPLKKFPVYKNMPAFLPYVLAALALNLLFGDVMVLALSRAVVPYWFY